jgi:capsular exopolysaccharide synthesis family protein
MEKTTGQTLENYKIEPFTLIHDIIVNWWVVILGAVAAAMLASVVMSVRYVPEYTTSATFIVSGRNTSASYSSLGTFNSMATSFQKVVQSNAMQDILCEKLGVDEIDAEIQVEIAGETNLLVLTVTDDSPQQAFDIMEGILDNYSSITLYTVGDIVLNMLETPNIPFSPDNPIQAGRVMKLAFLAAAAVIVFLLGVLSVMRDTLKTEEDISEKLDARNLGSIVYENKYKTIGELFRRKKKGLLINSPLAGFGFVESYRKLSSRVEYRMEKEGWKTLTVTSVSENEGKSTVAANLAISLAQKDYRVILVDGDLRRPAQFLIFNLRPHEENELGEFLRQEKQKFSLLMKTEVPKLYVIGGRNSYSSSTDILQGGVAGRFLKRCSESADFVIVDTPPTAVLGDAELWGQYTDAVLFVERQNYIYAEDINTMIDKFRAQDSRLLGVVLNGVQSFSQIAGAAAGRYGYGRYGKYGNYRRKHKGSKK